MKTSAYTPFEVGSKDRIVGLFVIGAVLLFLVGFLIPFVERFAAESGVSYHTVLDKTYGIAPNSTVSLRGVIIGNVIDVAITDDANVRVQVNLSADYRSFYTQGTRLTVDSNIGLNTILAGSGLILIPGPKTAKVLAPDSLLITDTPQGFSSFLDELDIVQLSDQVTEIVSNIEDITTEFTLNQNQIYKSLDNLEEVTANLAVVSQTLPAITRSAGTSLNSLESTMKGVDSLITTTDKNLQPMLLDLSGMTRQATETLAETEDLFRSTKPVMEQLPLFIMTTDVTLQSITTLTNQMSQSWLFGDSQSVIPASYIGPSLHPHDDTIYPEQRQHDEN